ncbi:MAG: hypothetical protein QM778_24465 [Myxococcales bacterium]
MKLLKISLCLVCLCGVARAQDAGTAPDQAEVHHESTTEHAPEELPENAPQGPVLQKLPEPVQEAASGLAQAHTPPAELMTDFFDLARSRMGSGTSWMPSSSPMYGLMTNFGSWGFMARGNIFLGYDWFSSDRGGKRFLSTNSLLFMMWHALGRGEFLPRVILSWEAFTMKHGYPLVGQTGDYSEGSLLHDRQHPHDLFSEIATMFSFPVHKELALQLYLALVGEPALGPGSYLYRVSAVSDPLAPLGYSYQDSPRTSAGVITAGLFSRQFKYEVSWFNGRGPDQTWWDIDLNVPDSLATRLTYNPSNKWSIQASYGYFHRPDPHVSDLSVHRLTTSAMYNVRSGPEANWASTLVFGQNVVQGTATSPSALAETNWNIDGHHTLYGRAEYADKFARTLIPDDPRSRKRFAVGMLSLGYAYYFRPLLSLSPGVGLRTSMVPLDAELEPIYGTRLAFGIVGYVQLRPSALVARKD